MAFALKGAGSATTANSAANNQASLVVTTATTAGAAGDLAVLLYAVDNNQTTDGDEGAVTGVVDSAGNFWSKFREFTNGQGTAQTGATCGVWWSNLQFALPIAGTVTLTFSTAASRDASAASLTYFTKAAGFDAVIQGANTLADDGAAAGSLDVTTANVACLRIRAIASESNVATALTKTAAFTAVLTQSIGDDGVAATSMGIRGEYLISTGTGQASAPTGGAGAVDNASVYVAFSETRTALAATYGDDVGAQVARIARKAVTAALITASAGLFLPPYPTVQAPTPALTSGIPVTTGSVAPRARKVYYQSNFIAPYAAPAAAVTPAPQGWQAPLSVAPNPPNAQPGLVTGPFGPTPIVTLAWQAPLSVVRPAAKAQAGNSFVPYNTAQLSVNFTNFGWHVPLSPAPAVAKAQAGNSFVPYNTAQVVVAAAATEIGVPVTTGNAPAFARVVYAQTKFETPYVAPVTNLGWHAPLSPAPAVANATPGYSDIPYNTAQVAAYTNYGWFQPLSPAPRVAKAQAGNSFVPYNTAQVAAAAAATEIGVPVTMGNAPAAARLVYAQQKFDVPYLPPTVVGATGIPLTTGNAPPSARVVYAQTKFDVLYVAPATPALNYTNFGWYAPLAKPAPVAKAQPGYSFVPFNTAQVPAAPVEIGIPLDLGGAAPRTRTTYYQSKFFPLPAVATAPKGWQPPLSVALPPPKAQAGYASVPYNTAQLAVNYQNLGWYAPLAGAPLVAKAQPGSSFVPFNTAQVIVNYTNLGWYQPLSVAVAVARPRQGDSFVPYNTAQVIAAAYTKFWQQPLSVAVPVAKASADFGSVPYFTPSVVSVAWQQPLSIAPAVASAPLVEWPLPYSVTTVVSLQWQPPLSGAAGVQAAPQSDFATLPPYTAPVVVAYVASLEWQQPLAKPAPLAAPASVGYSFVPFNTVQVATEPPETGTILMPGKAGGGGFTRKRWREIQEQEAAQRRAILEQQKADRDEAARVKALAQEARAAKIAAKADAVADKARLDAVVQASETQRLFLEQSAKEEAAFLAAMLAEIANQEDEDDAIMLLVGF